MSHPTSSVETVFRIVPLLLLLMLASCVRQEFAASGRLSLRTDVLGSFHTKATVPDVSALMEDDLSGGLDVYLSGHGIFRHYRLGSPVNGGVHLLTTRWRTDGIQPRLDYDVHVIANADPALPVPGDEGALAALVAGPDADIYRLYDQDAGSYDLSKTADKHFLMFGHSRWTPSDADEQTIPVVLVRAAAKIEINFALGAALADYTFFGTPQWKLLNYATSVSVSDSGPSFSPAVMSTPSLMDVSAHSAQEASITTYCYPRTWTDPAEATAVLLNIPLKDAHGQVRGNNYYYIPVTDPGAGVPQSLQRNTRYRVDVRLESLGSSGEQATDHPLWLNYEVLPWEYDSATDDIEVVARGVDYLMVDPTIAELREKVLAEGFAARTLKLNFWSSDAISYTAPQVYYYDKTGTRIDASSIAPVSVSVSGTRSGTVELTSTALTNNTVKYIRLRVYLTQQPAIFEDILIRHYPLDYIQNIEGLWSSLTSDNWVDWITDQTEHPSRKTVENAMFPAKVFYNNQIHRIIEQWSGSYYRAVPGTRFSGLTNNRMYVVQITSTSDDYTVGRVHLDNNFLSQDHWVSPAFIIASQLGASWPVADGRTAAAHCRAYKEVTAAGVAYTQWRLPTREEIGIIMGYQYTSDAIDEVLSGDYYWTLEGSAVSKNHFSDPSEDSTQGYIRCVRDLTAEDLLRINNQE